MKSMIKLLVAAAFATAAFVGMRMYLANKSGLRSFAQVTKKLSADGQTKFSVKDDLAEIEIAMPESATLRALSWDQRQILDGANVARNYEIGDLVMLSDIKGAPDDLVLEPGESALSISLEGVAVESGLLKVGRLVGFVVQPGGGEGDETAAVDRENAARAREEAKPLEQLGPFRIVSVGSVIREEPAVNDEFGARQNADTISVATKLQSNNVLKDDAGRLVMASKSKKILAVTLYRVDQTPPAVGPQAANAPQVDDLPQVAVSSMIGR